ncbi:hypothetical protein [Flavonifractor plautii]|jgi:hypothetical protein|uniref:hypothetical protein n=1 Tax=Flavonifractor plautii TaxID=292800 RepID=UPI00210A70CB|nr:hypothetical protein [Flavonifractor plautii]MCQ5309542.1 hypothetical protein [Flavonifractor plautii]
MQIRDGSKKILEFMLQKVVAHGSLSDKFFIDYKQLADDLHLESEGYCAVCCQYLHQLGYIYIVRKDDNGARFVELTAKGIDFLETT